MFFSDCFKCIKESKEEFWARKKNAIQRNTEIVHERILKPLKKNERERRYILNDLDFYLLKNRPALSMIKINLSLGNLNFHTSFVSCMCDRCTAGSTLDQKLLNHAEHKMV